jgi:hypothetical protein
MHLDVQARCRRGHYRVRVGVCAFHSVGDEVGIGPVYPGSTPCHVRRDTLSDHMPIFETRFDLVAYNGFLTASASVRLRPPLAPA